jgi:hypothetical protein
MYILYCIQEHSERQKRGKRAVKEKARRMEWAKSSERYTESIQRAELNKKINEYTSFLIKLTSWSTYIYRYTYSAQNKFKK